MIGFCRAGSFCIGDSECLLVGAIATIGSTDRRSANLQSVCGHDSYVGPSTCQHALVPDRHAIEICTVIATNASFPFSTIGGGCKIDQYPKTDKQELL